MIFSILFWNIWYLNQVGDDTRYKVLLNELNRLAVQHKPDVVALSEVVRPSNKKSAPVIEYLRKLGYHYNHCASMAQYDSYWMSGVALCSRLPINQKQNIIISKNIVITKDGLTTNRGYPNLKKEAISVQVALSESQDFQVIVAHPQDTLHAFKYHWTGIKKLNELVHSKACGKNTIMVGDMNEWRLIPGAFRRKAKDVMHSRTGSLLNPTWRYNAHRFTPFRLNLDYVYWNKQSDFYLKDFKVLSSNASDHQPLLATFELNNS